MKRRGRKFIFATVALIVSLAVATGTTFAWFSTNREVFIDYFEVTASTGSANLSLAANSGTDYNKNTVSFTRAVDLSRTPVRNDEAENLTEYLDLIGAIRMDALTLDDADGHIALYDANGSKIGYDDYSPESRGKAADDGTGNDYHRFIEFTLHFKGDRAMTVYLSSSSVDDVETETRKVSATEEAEANKYGRHDAIHVGDKIPAKASDAVRVAFIPVDTSDGDDPRPATSLENIRVWCPNEARYDGGEISSDAEAQRKETALSGYYKNNLARDYFNSLGRGDKTYVAKAYSPVINIEEALSAGEELSLAKLALLSASEGFTATFKVLIWLEGTDGDCFDTIMKDKLSISLHFVGDASKII